MSEGKRPYKSSSEKEVDKAQQQFTAFDEEIKSMTLDRMNEAPKKELEPQMKLSQGEIDKNNNMYLKPIKTISCSQKDKFNEKFRSEYNEAKEYVNFTAVNNEIVGEAIDLWTRPFGGMPAEEWKVPTNRPVWGPRYLAKQIKNCTYHTLTMQQSNMTGGDQMGNYYGSMAVQSTNQRLDAHPVSNKKQIFMGSNNF
jgi:hypothetical protein